MKLIKSLLLLLSLMLANSVYATSFLNTKGLTVGDVNEYINRAPLLNNYFDREKYKAIGIIYSIVQTKYNMLEDGEYWKLKLIDDSTGQAVSWQITFRARWSPYDEAVCIYRDYYSNGFIDLSDPARWCFPTYMGSSEYIMFTFGMNWPIYCNKPGGYGVSMNYALGLDEHPFELSAYIPGKPIITGMADISPSIPASPTYSGIKGETTAGKMDITIEIKDNLDCNIPLKDIETSLTMTVVPLSGSHLHNTDPDKKGTGVFISSIPETTISQNHTFSVKTDQNGKIKTTYEAGIYGVDEKLTVVAHVPDSGKTKESEEVFAIKVPNLVPLLTGGDSYSLRGSYKTSCDKIHNAGSTFRSSHYVTPFTKGKIKLLNDAYKKYTGNDLCLNDASLANGGYFDNGAGGECHISHRQGIDIDVNTKKNIPCTEDLNNETVSYNGTIITKRSLLDKLARQLKALKVKEPSLHYRFSR